MSCKKNISRGVSFFQVKCSHSLAGACVSSISSLVSFSLHLKPYVAGINTMIEESNAGRTTPPAEMEVAHDAIAVAYSLVQRHGDVFLSSDSGGIDSLTINSATATKTTTMTTTTMGAETLASLVLALTRSLRQPALSREAAISAGVTIAAAAGVGAGAHAHAIVLADAIFPTGGGGGEEETGEWSATAGLPQAPIDAVILGPARATSLAAEVARFTPFGRLSVIRGLLTAAPSAALSARLTPPPGYYKRATDCIPAEEDIMDDASGGDGEEEEEGFSVLLDGALPAICAAMENPIDAHYKFHASAALKSALLRTRQVAEKTATEHAGGGGGGGKGRGEAMEVDFNVAEEEEENKHENNGVAVAADDDVLCWKSPLTLSDDLTSRVLSILWANWEDPLSQTVREVQGAFEQLLDIKTAQRSGANDERGRNKFLISAAAQLLEKGAHCKGRYVPLSVIVPRLGARNLLELRPDLLSETLTAMRDDSVCCAAGSLIAALSSKLLSEMQREERGAAGAAEDDDDDDDDDEENGDNGGDGGGVTSTSFSTQGGGGNNTKKKKKKKKKKGFKGPKGLGGRDEVCIGGGGGVAVTEWQRWWIPPLLRALLSPGRVRNGAGNYALPPLLKQDGASIVPLLEALVHVSGDDAVEDDHDHAHDEDVDEDASEMTQKRKRKQLSMTSNDGDEGKSGRKDSVIYGGTGGNGSSGEKKEEKAKEKEKEDEGGASGERRSAALVAVLRCARATSLLDPTCLARVSPAVSAAAGRSIPYEVPTELLERAVVCRETRTRCDALEMVCIDGRKASLPGALELDLLRRALPVCLRADNAAFRNALGSMMRSLLVRIKSGTTRAAVLIRQRAKRAAAMAMGGGGGGTERFGKNIKGTAAYTAEEAEETVSRARVCVRWTRWLVRTLLASSYPGAPYERKYMALDLLNAVAETWGMMTGDAVSGGGSSSTGYTMGKQYGSGGGGGGGGDEDKEKEDNQAIDAASEAAAVALEASPYLPCLGADCTTSLLGAAVDSWDKLRASAFSLLARHPAPLAGMETPDKLEARLRWALALLRSPRVRESDAAALLLRLLFRKYALDLGWDVRLTPEPKAMPPPPGAAPPSRGETGAILLGALTR